MHPTAHLVALAIVEASKHTGADPEAVVAGKYDGIGTNYATSRARMYAALALYELFKQPKMVARLVGVTASSQEIYLATFRTRLKNQEARWFKREIVDAVKAKLRPPPYRPPPGTVEKMLAGARPHPGGQLEPDGYRPPDGTIRLVIEDDDDGPVLGKNHYGLERQRDYAPSDSKRELFNMLRAAVANTAKMPQEK